MRSLAPEEKALWDRVTATIRPLSREPLRNQAEPTEPSRSEDAIRPSSPPKPTKRRPNLPISGRQSIGNTLDGSWDRKVSSGKIEPDRILDLHGLTLDQAWGAIDSALDRAISAGDRVLLLITGHERPGEPPLRRGRIRAAVHDWLAASPHMSRIAAVRGAHLRHGGGGSLYIILRRN